MDRRWGVRMLLAVCVCMPAGAQAYEYNEHELASRKALAKLEGRIGQDVMATAREVLDPKLLCAVPSSDCLALSDITAIAGDLSGDPENMTLRYFSQRNDAKEVEVAGFWTRLLKLAKSAVLSVKHIGDQNPNSARSGRTNGHALLPVVRKPVPTDGEKCHEYYSNQMQQLNAFTNAGLVTMASMNLSHFEFSEAKDSRIPQNLLESRAENYFKYTKYEQYPGLSSPVATESAMAYYVELHGLAILLHGKARAVCSAGGEDCRSRRQELDAFALIFELYALHYLQDLYVPGHRLYDLRAQRGDVLRRKGHQCMNKKGEVVALRDEARFCAWAQADFPGVCDGTGRLVKTVMHGDAFHSCGDTSSEQELIAAISAWSMDEVFSEHTVGLEGFDVFFPPPGKPLVHHIEKLFDDA